MDASDLDDMLILAGLQLEGIVSSSQGQNGKSQGGQSQQEQPSNLDGQPFLETTPQWLEHLVMRSQHEEVARDAAAELTVLKWVYGKTVHSSSEEFAARQRELRAGRERDVVVLELYDDVAYAWRSLQAAIDQRNRLEDLRKSARTQFALVGMGWVIGVDSLGMGHMFGA